MSSSPGGEAGEIEMLELAALNQAARQIVFVQALLYHNDAALLLVVQTRQKCLLVESGLLASSLWTRQETSSHRSSLPMTT